MGRSPDNGFTPPATKRVEIEGILQIEKNEYHPPAGEALGGCRAVSLFICAIKRSFIAFTLLFESR